MLVGKLQTNGENVFNIGLYLQVRQVVFLVIVVGGKGNIWLLFWLGHLFNPMIL
jgi:hypothetical protein